ncbi:MAG: hypothetical protein HN576_00525 [Bacteriovoracaceae bacterium]|mgnify:CR=1 FL=1|jgi:hypothetical protein|nr:hypothetical protein [Bacteriovoracaceae bacterium]
MKKFSINILLTLIYLGLSKSFSPSEQHSPYLIDKRVFSSFFTDAPIEVILLDSFQTGFLIKTYFQKFKVFYGFKPPEIQILRTSPEFWNKNIKNLGMSLFRRIKKDQPSNTTPMPPGALFIGNMSFGSWHLQNDGQKYWKFFRAYRHFPKNFSWKKFIPSYKFFTKMNIHLQHEQEFYGLNNEFGATGSITKQTFKNTFDIANNNNIKVEIKTHFNKFFKTPVWKKEQ